jgi:hypothetical protein
MAVHEDDRPPRGFGGGRGRRRLRTGTALALVGTGPIPQRIGSDEDESVSRFGLASLGFTAEVDPSRDNGEEDAVEDELDDFEAVADALESRHAADDDFDEETDEADEIDDPDPDEIDDDLDEIDAADEEDAAHGDAADEEDAAYGDAAYEEDEDVAELDDEPAAVALLDRADPTQNRIAEAVLAHSYDTHPEVMDAFRSVPHEGDRVDGWIRPNYDDEIPSGDYWTPVPNTDYGWPVPVERLRMVPPDSEAEGEAEPTTVVPQWPPARPSSRIELPRSWANLDDAPAWDEDFNEQAPPGRWAEVDQQPDHHDRWPVTEGQQQRPRRRAMSIRRLRNGTAATEYLPAVAESTQMLPSVEAEPRRRPRPRPNPHAEARSTVYVSRHAAEPSQQ